MATTTQDKHAEARDEDGRFAKDAKPAAAKAKPTPKADEPKRAPAKPATKAKRDDDGAPRKSGKTETSTGALLGAAAAGVAVGLGIALGRKIAVQAPTALAGDWDKALAAEHAAVIKIFDVLQTTTSKNTGKRTLLLAQMKHALAKHALQEENVVYPALRDAGEIEGADQLNHEHGYVKQYLYELENCPKDSDEFLVILAKFRTDLEEHVREEENDLYPKLKRQLSTEANKAVTRAMNKEGFKLA